MPNCKKCGAEVDPDQKTCAWCGEENPLKGGKPAAPAATTSSSGSELRVHKGTGPSVEDARKLAQMGDMSGALSLFTRILEAQPSNEEALFGIGGVHFKIGDSKKAIEQWLKLKVINPQYPNLENWIQQAKQKLPPPVPKKEPHPPVSTEPEEDWQRQSVRVTEEMQQEALAKAAESPPPSPSQVEPEIEEILEEDDGIVRPKSWVIPLGWGLIVLYIGLIWLFYFSSIVRS